MAVMMSLGAVMTVFASQVAGRGDGPSALTVNGLGVSCVMRPCVPAHRSTLRECCEVIDTCRAEVDGLVTYLGATIKVTTYRHTNPPVRSILTCILWVWVTSPHAGGRVGCGVLSLHRGAHCGMGTTSGDLNHGV